MSLLFNINSTKGNIYLFNYLNINNNCICDLLINDFNKITTNMNSSNYISYNNNQINNEKINSLINNKNDNDDDTNYESNSDNESDNESDNKSDDNNNIEYNEYNNEMNEKFKELNLIMLMMYNTYRGLYGYNNSKKIINLILNDKKLLDMFIFFLNEKDNVYYFINDTYDYIRKMKYDIKKFQIIYNILDNEIFTICSLKMYKYYTGYEEEQKGFFSIFTDNESNIEEILYSLKPIIMNKKILNKLINKIFTIININKCYTFSDFNYNIDFKKYTPSSIKFLYIIYNIILHIFNEYSHLISIDGISNLKLIEINKNTISNFNIYNKILLITLKTFTVINNSIFNNMYSIFNKYNRIKNNISNSDKSNFNYIKKEFEYYNNLCFNNIFECLNNKFLKFYLNLNINLYDNFIESFLSFIEGINNFSIIGIQFEKYEIQYIINCINGLSNNPHYRIKAFETFYLISKINYSFDSDFINILFKYINEVDIFKHLQERNAFSHLILLKNIFIKILDFNNNNINFNNNAFQALFIISSKILDIVDNIIIFNKDINDKLNNNKINKFDYNQIIKFNSTRFNGYIDTLIDLIKLNKKLIKKLNIINDPNFNEFFNNIFKFSNQLLKYLSSDNFLYLHYKIHNKCFDIVYSIIYLLYSSINHKSLILLNNETITSLNYFINNNNFINYFANRNLINNNNNPIKNYFISHKKDKIIFKSNLLINIISDNIKLYDNIDYPSQFLDPLTSSPIIEPVMIPSINEIFDKSSIIQHIYNKNNNPYTREPLTIDILNKYNQSDYVINKINKFKNDFYIWKKNILLNYKSN